MKKKFINWAIAFSALLLSTGMQAQEILNLDLLNINVECDSIRQDGHYTRGYKGGEVVAVEMEKLGFKYQESRRGIGTISAFHDPKEGTTFTLDPSDTRQRERIKPDTVLVFGDAKFKVKSELADEGSYVIQHTR